MSEFGVRATMASGEAVLITVEAVSAEAARREVERHRTLFYGNGDAPGRWLAARKPDTTVTAVHEAKPIAEWD